MPAKLGGIALGLTNIMWRLYERRYGDEAVRRVREITAERDRLLRTVEQLARELSRAEQSERALAADNDRLRVRVSELAARINDRAASDLLVPLPENPYVDEPEVIEEMHVCECGNQHSTALIGSECGCGRVRGERLRMRFYAVTP